MRKTSQSLPGQTGRALFRIPRACVIAASLSNEISRRLRGSATNRFTSSIRSKMTLMRMRIKPRSSTPHAPAYSVQAPRPPRASTSMKQKKPCAWRKRRKKRAPARLRVSTRNMWSGNCAKNNAMQSPPSSLVIWCSSSLSSWQSALRCTTVFCSPISW